MEEKELKSIITREGVNLGVNESGQDINAEKNTSLVQVGATNTLVQVPVFQDTKTAQRVYKNSLKLM